MDVARRHRIFGLALPIVGGMVSQNLLNIVDTAMVGFVGDAALAAVGLGGIYLNVKGKRPQGIVEPGDEAVRLRKEIQQKLRGMRDEEKNETAIAEVHDLKELYKGPYVGEAPDLLAGFRVGYRASWGCATGVIEEQAISDNLKSWSGDHCMNPPDVPGIFFCNRKLGVDRVNIMDIGPTVLDLFGVPVPDYCDGKSFMPGEA